MTEECLDKDFWKQKCRQFWDRFDDNERFAIRMGLIPHWTAQELESAWGRPLTMKESKALALGLFDQADQRGRGMIA